MLASLMNRRHIPFVEEYKVALLVPLLARSWLPLYENEAAMVACAEAHTQKPTGTTEPVQLSTHRPNDTHAGQNRKKMHNCGHAADVEKTLCDLSTVHEPEKL